MNKNAANKLAARLKIEELKTTLKELQDIVDAPENTLGISIPTRAEEYWFLTSSYGSIYPTPKYTRDTALSGRVTYGFTSKEAAQRWNNTFDTLLQIRAQRGATSLEKASAALIYSTYTKNATWNIVNEGYTAPDGHIVLGYFASSDEANKARDIIGKDKLIYAGKTLIGDYNESN